MIALDEASQNVVAFLEGIAAARRGLNEVWTHYARRGLKVSRHFGLGPVWLEGSLQLGVWVIGGDGNEYDLCVHLQWSDREWVIHADASREERENGYLAYPVLRKLPARRSDDVPHCLEHLRAAVAELKGFDDLIPGPTPA